MVYSIEKTRYVYVLYYRYFRFELRILVSVEYLCASNFRYIKSFYFFRNFSLSNLAYASHIESCINFNCEIFTISIRCRWFIGIFIAFHFMFISHHASNGFIFQVFECTYVHTYVCNNCILACALSYAIASIYYGSVARRYVLYLRLLQLMQQCLGCLYWRLGFLLRWVFEAYDSIP